MSEKMTTSEPTTGEIVRALRCDGCDGTCSECFFGYEEKDSIGYETWGCRRGELDNIAADRLESQEQTIATMRGDSFDAISVTNVLAYLDTVIGLIHCADGIKDLIVSMQGTAIELNARAEQAELERDAAIAACSGWCETCAFSGDCAKHDNNDSSAGFSWYTDCEDWEWRGLPQEGEGK